MTPFEHVELSQLGHLSVANQVKVSGEIVASQTETVFSFWEMELFAF